MEVYAGLDVSLKRTETCALSKRFVGM